MDFLHRVQAVLVLDHYGDRVFAKYYTGEDAPARAKALEPLEKQRALEQSITAAIAASGRGLQPSTGPDIMLVDGHTVLYQLGEDLAVVVVGDEAENELVLLTVLQALVEALKLELNTDELSIVQLLERYDALLLTVDELLDEGIVLETNEVEVAGKVEPYLVDSSAESTRKALTTVNKYLRENL